MIGPTVYRLLSGATAVTNLAGNRIFPHVAPESDETGKAIQYPVIVYTVIDDVPTNSLSGWTSKLHNARVQVDVWAKGYVAAETLADAIRGALAGVCESSLTVKPLSRQDFFEDEAGLYRVSQDYSLWMRES